VQSAKCQHSIDSFLFQHHKSRQQNKARILRLLDLDFLDHGTNIVLVGNPGTGKTFLSKIIGWSPTVPSRTIGAAGALGYGAVAGFARELEGTADPQSLCDFGLHQCAQISLPPGATRWRSRVHRTCSKSTNVSFAHTACRRASRSTTWSARSNRVRRT
jgi:hypothetical protein